MDHSDIQNRFVKPVFPFFLISFLLFNIFECTEKTSALELRQDTEIASSSDLEKRLYCTENTSALKMRQGTEIRDEVQAQIR